MNGYLCIGGPADGQYHNPAVEPEHMRPVLIAPRMTGPVAYSAFARSFDNWDNPVAAAEYVFWGWTQGRWKAVNPRFRWYLIPPDWDGFEAMDHLERKAYAGLED